MLKTKKKPYITPTNYIVKKITHDVHFFKVFQGKKKLFSEEFLRILSNLQYVPVIFSVTILFLIRQETRLKMTH